MGNSTVQKAIVVSPVNLNNNMVPLQLALFGEDGEAWEPLMTPAAAQADFAGADLTALKVELNAFLAKLEAAGLVATA